MTYLAIDPGIDTGWAVFYDRNTMIACGLGDPRPSYIMAKTERVLKVLIEKPKVYQARNMKGDPNDLITLAIRVGQYREAWEQAPGIVSVRLVVPNEWKGRQSKEVNNARTVEDLSPSERDVVRAAARTVPYSKQHNMLDAIGLGRAGFDRRLW